MIINFNDRSSALFNRNKLAEALALQEQENQSKILRNLCAIFNDNINILGKNFKSVLGEIELMPKIKVSREDIQLTYQNLKRIYPKFQNKLARDLLQRNTVIRKSYQDYKNYYDRTNNESEINTNEQKQVINQNVYTESIKNIYDRSYSRNNNSSLSSKRPLSSKGSKTINNNILEQAYESFTNRTGPNSYKMRTISGLSAQNNYESIKYRDYHKTINPQKHDNIFSRPKKVFFHGQKRYEEGISGQKKKFEQFLFDGTQILIRQRTHKNETKQIISNNGFICTNPFAPINSKKAIVTTSKYAQRKSIDEIQKMQIQNRILMVNSVLSVGLPISQGYRPKSRCWQNFFN